MQQPSSTPPTTIESIQQYFAEHCPTLFADCRALQVRPLLGGNSNQMFLVSGRPTEHRVILRIYGEGMGSAVDREKDLAATEHMSAAGLGPTLLAVAPWGRVERFIDNAEPATTTRLQNDALCLRMAAVNLRQMHHLSNTADVDQATSALTARREEDPQLSLGLSRMLSRLRSFVVSQQQPEDGHASVYVQLLDALQSEFEWLRRHLLVVPDDVEGEEQEQPVADGTSTVPPRTAVGVHSPVVFGHNDLNPGNILVSTCEADGGGKGIQLTLLDFEYAGRNHRCFDLGNTLCELDYDYGEAEDASGGGPNVGFTKPLQKGTASLHSYEPLLPQAVYKAFLQPRQETEKDDAVRPWAERCGAHVCRSFLEPYFHTDTLQRAHMLEVFAGVLASHLYWGTWAVLLALEGSRKDTTKKKGNQEEETVRLGEGASGLSYAAYGECRLKEFTAMKDWVQSEFTEFQQDPDRKSVV